jgi:hypothetical protein
MPDNHELTEFLCNETLRLPETAHEYVLVYWKP